MNTSCWCCPTCLASKLPVRGKTSDHETDDDQDVFETVSQRKVNGTIGQESESGCYLRYPYSQADCRDLVCSLDGLEFEYDETSPLFHVIRVLDYHPKYLKSFLETYQYLLHESGPIPYEYRFLIGIMAAGRHQCTYLIRALTAEFTCFGCDEALLNGFEYMPQKLKDLYEINMILAHRPWQLTTQHLDKLHKESSPNNWSISELTQAIVLLVFFHSFCSLIFSCGISVDDCDRASVSSCGSVADSTAPDGSHKVNSGSESSGVEHLLKNMQRLGKEKALEITPDELRKRFEKVESQSVDLVGAKRARSPEEDVLCYTKNLDFTYIDFATEVANDPSLEHFSVDYFSWDDCGYSMANTNYPNIGELLDAKFRVITDLTYNTIANNIDIDTSTFRQAIWNYTQCMFGMCHDDYDYDKINILLDKNLRSYIKTVTCFPELVSRASYERVVKDFLHSEKVHINIMIHEARFQAQLLYGLRTLSKYHR